ncbi:MAG: hypothetical protein IK085_04735 [Clostridia bacterium]|nr:hypothetical protein [Clostridia bacterium]
MKKKIIISAAALLIIGLFVPIPKAYADGTKSYNAIAYKIVKWNRPFYKNLMFTQKEVYKFPHSLKSVDELWEGMEIDPAVSEVSGVVVDAAENGASVEVLEGDGDVLPGEIIEVPADNNLEESDTVKVEYVPGGKESGKKIEQIVDVRKESKAENTVKESTSKAKNAEPVYIKSTRECEYPITGGKAKLGTDDAGTVINVFGKYEFKVDPYDNLPDYEIIIGSHRYLYESSSGIVTDTVIKKVNEEKSIVLSKADRDSINKIIRSYADSSGSTVEKITAVDYTQHDIKPAESADDTIHYIRLSWKSSADYPQVVFIKNKAQYESLFDAQQLSQNNGEIVYNPKYNDAFFKDHALVVIFTSESSGSNYYTGVKINSDKNEIYINRYIPEVRTADMASWAIICEVSADDPILTKDNTKTQVIKTE